MNELESVEEFSLDLRVRHLETAESSGGMVPTGPGSQCEGCATWVGCTVG